MVKSPTPTCTHDPTFTPALIYKVPRSWFGHQIKILDNYTYRDLVNATHTFLGLIFVYCYLNEHAGVRYF